MLPAVCGNRKPQHTTNGYALSHSAHRVVYADVQQMIRPTAG